MSNAAVDARSYRLSAIEMLRGLVIRCSPGSLVMFGRVPFAFYVSHFYLLPLVIAPQFREPREVQD